MLHPEQGDDVASYKHRLLGKTQNDEPVYVLDATEDGRCVYLDSFGCTIYKRRPLLCRTFDCRQHYLILPRQDRDNLVRIGLASRAVFNAGRARLRTLSPEERSECIAKRTEFFS